MHSRSEGPAFFCLWDFASVEEIPGFFYSTLPSQIWKVIFLFIKWEQIYVKLANFHLFQCVFRRKNADPQSVLANKYQCNLFSYILGNLPKNYLHSQLEDPNDISSHHDVWAVQSPKGNIKYSSITISHPFIVLYRLRRWSRGPSSLTSFYGVVFIVYQKDRVFTDGRLFHVLRRLMYMIKPWIS